MNKSPWTDRNGTTICEHDEVQILEGARGRVVFLRNYELPQDQWRIEWFGYGLEVPPQRVISVANRIQVVEKRGRLTKWTPTQNRLILRRMGKLGEECGELTAVTNRVIIQGLDEVDPATGLTNRVRLSKELADVLAQIECTIDALKLNYDEISIRVADKKRQMAEWDAMLVEEDAHDQH